MLTAPYHELKGELDHKIQKRGPVYLCAYYSLRALSVLFNATEGAASGSAMFMILGYMIGAFEAPIAIPTTRLNLSIYSTLWGLLTLIYTYTGIKETPSLNTIKADRSKIIDLEQAAQTAEDGFGADKLPQASSEIPTLALSETHIDTAIQAYKHQHQVTCVIGESATAIQRCGRGAFAVGLVDILTIESGNLGLHALIPYEVAAVGAGFICRLAHYLAERLALKTVPTLEDHRGNPSGSLLPSWRAGDFSKLKLILVYTASLASYTGLATWWSDLVLQAMNQYGQKIDSTIEMICLSIGMAIVAGIFAFSALYSEWLAQVRSIISHKEYLHVEGGTVHARSQEHLILIPQDKTIFKQAKTYWQLLTSVIFASILSVKGNYDFADHLQRKTSESEQPEPALSPFIMLGLLGTYLVINALIFMMGLTRNDQQAKLDKLLTEHYNKKERTQTRDQNYYERLRKEAEAETEGKSGGVSVQLLGGYPGEGANGALRLSPISRRSSEGSEVALSTH